MGKFKRWFQPAIEAKTSFKEFGFKILAEALFAKYGVVFIKIERDTLDRVIAAIFWKFNVAKKNK